MRGVRRVVLWLAGLGLGGWLAYAVLLVALHPGYIYPFSDEAFTHAAYARHDVAGGPVAYVAPGEGPVVLYFMGNVGALGPFLPMLEHHRTQGRTVVAMAYRGGGGLPGTPSEAALKDDARALYDALPDILGRAPGPVVAHGFSLGTGLATHVAAARSVDGVILSAPYTSLCTLMAAASYLPACLIPGVQRWNSLAEAPHIRAPALVLHGSADRLIPPAHGRRLAEAVPGAAFAEIPGGGHSDLMDFPGYLTQIDAFIDALAPPGSK